MDNFIEPTWEELYYLLPLYFPKPKDTSFTAQDIIRFYHNNLDFEEQKEVKEYFCALCEEEYPEPEPEPEPIIPQLPPIIPIPLPGPSPPQLPPPVDQIPPPKWYLPVWPFIIPGALPHDILEFLLDELGINQVHAELIEENEQLKIKLAAAWDTMNDFILKEPPRKSVPQRIEESKIEENGSYSPDYQPEIIEIPPDDDDYQPWDPNIPTLPPQTSDDTTDNDEETDDFEIENIKFEALLVKLYSEASRLGIFLDYWGFFVSNGIRWYDISMNGEHDYYSLSELEYLLEVLRNME